MDFLLVLVVLAPAVEVFERTKRIVALLKKQDGARRRRQGVGERSLALLLEGLVGSSMRHSFYLASFSATAE